MAQAGRDLLRVIPSAAAVHLQQAILVHIALQSARFERFGVKGLWAASVGLCRFAPREIGKTPGFTGISATAKGGCFRLQHSMVGLGDLGHAIALGSHLGSRWVREHAEGAEDKTDEVGGEGRN